MRHLAWFAVCLLIPGTMLLGQGGVQPVDNAPNPYTTIGGWGTLPPGRAWGGTSGVHVDRDGRSVWVAERCGGIDCVSSALAPILEFDANGTLVASFGAGLFHTPHGVDVAREGNVWVTAFIPDATPTAMPITAAEGVAVDAAGNIYGALVPARMVQKHVKR